MVIISFQLIQVRVFGDKIVLINFILICLFLFGRVKVVGCRGWNKLLYLDSI